MSKFYGESEARLREIFQKPRRLPEHHLHRRDGRNSAQTRGSHWGSGETSSCTAPIVDDGWEREETFMLRATNRPLTPIDPRAKTTRTVRPGDEIASLTRWDGYEILQIHTRTMPLASDVDLHRLSDMCHGYTGADISSLCREGAMKALRRYLPEINLEEGDTYGILEKMEVISRTLRMRTERSLRPRCERSTSKFQQSTGQM